MSNVVQFGTGRRTRKDDRIAIIESNRSALFRAASYIMAALQSPEAQNPRDARAVERAARLLTVRHGGQLKINEIPVRFLPHAIPCDVDGPVLWFAVPEKTVRQRR